MTIQGYTRDCNNVPHITVGDEYGTCKVKAYESADDQARAIESTKSKIGAANVLRTIMLVGSVIAFVIFLGSSGAHAVDPTLGIKHIKSAGVGAGGCITFGAIGGGQVMALMTNSELRKTLDEAKREMQSDEAHQGKVQTAEVDETRQEATRTQLRERASRLARRALCSNRDDVADGGDAGL